MSYSTYMLKALFNSLMYGADKIPDSWFEKVPGGYYRQKERAEQERRRQHRRAQHYSDVANGKEDDGYRSDDYDNRRGRGVRYHEDDYDSEAQKQYGRGRARGQSAGAVRRDLDGSRSEELPLGGVYGQRPYNPADYAAVRTGEREDRYDHQQYDLMSVQTGLAAGTAAAAAPYADPTRPSSSGPASGGYVPYADIYSSQPENPYPSKLQNAAAHKETSNAYPRPHHADQSYNQSQYQPANPYAHSAYSGDDHSETESPHSRGSADGHRRRKHRHHSRSRQKSKSRNRSQSRARSSFRERLDTSEKGVGYGTIGALAGGLVGNEVGKGLLPTAVGAVLGGLGANVFEGREKKKREKRQSGRFDDYREEGHNGRFDDRGDGRYDARAYDHREDRYKNDRYTDDRYDDNRRHSGDMRRSSKRNSRRRDEYYSD
ncbi:hypothetical protein MBLNU459_g6149t2 [Dothideomycetes sp. NU459]